MTKRTRLLQYWGSLSNYDDDDDNNVKKKIGLMIKTDSSARASRFLIKFFWLPLHERRETS